MPIEVKDVSFLYNKSTIMETSAIKNISLTINEGEFIGLIGHTGSGKSTLIQLLNGLITPSLGKVLYNGQDINEKGFSKIALRSKVGLVFQYPEYQLFEDTVFKDVAFGPKNLKLAEDEIHNRVVEALGLVNLGKEYYDKSPFLLSGGEKRRVAIAGVLAMKPDFLILDEPAAGLDPIGRKNILRGIENLNKKLGMTIIMVSHSMEDVANFADRILVMKKGRLIFNDSPLEVFSHYQELIDIGLSIPMTTKILLALKLQGWDIDYMKFNVEDAKNEIMKVIKSND